VQTERLSADAVRLHPRADARAFGAEWKKVAQSCRRRRERPSVDLPLCSTLFELANQLRVIDFARIGGLAPVVFFRRSRVRRISVRERHRLERARICHVPASKTEGRLTTLLRAVAGVAPDFPCYRLL